MKPLSIIYWSRAGFGVVAALFCALLQINNLMNGMMVAILVYLSTYYILKGLFVLKVEKTSKIVTVGIGAYFLTWIVAWGLLYTFLF